MINRDVNADWDFINSLTNPENYRRIGLPEKTTEKVDESHNEQPTLAKEKGPQKINYILSGEGLIPLLDECPPLLSGRDSVRSTILRPDYSKHNYFLDVIETDEEWAFVRIHMPNGEGNTGWILKQDISFLPSVEDNEDLFDGRFNVALSIKVNDPSDCYEGDYDNYYDDDDYDDL
jgi:hypothetical protein